VIAGHTLATHGTRSASGPRHTRAQHAADAAKAAVRKRDTVAEILFEANLAHPLDAHPTNSQREQALGVDMGAVLRRALLDIGYPAETERCNYLEREITFLELKSGARAAGEERGGPPRAAISN